MSWQDHLTENEQRALKKESGPQWRAPMLATLTHDHFTDSDWLYERKRCPFEECDEALGKGVHWLAPMLVAEIGFTEWTADNRLRHPRYLGCVPTSQPRRWCASGRRRSNGQDPDRWP